MERIIFENGRIMTLDETNPQAEAVYVENGKIIAIGRNQDIRAAYDGFEVEKVDWQGAYVYPGLVDSHMHLSMLGQKLHMIDFQEVRSKEEMLQLIRQQAKQLPVDRWILGHGWQENMMNGEIPSLEELEEATLGRPALLSRVCFHGYLANERAAELAGVRPHQEEPLEGAYGRDSSGRWDGRVYENASRPFHLAQPKPTYEEKKAILRQAMKLALSCGLTAVHTEDVRYIESVAELIQIHRELQQEGVYLRTHQLIYQPFFHQLEELQLKFRDGDEWLRIGPMKMFADGSLGSRTAWLQSPYADDLSTTGIAIYTDEQILTYAREAERLGYPIAVHAIGDGAADQVIRTISQLKRQPKNGISIRHRLIHAQILQPLMIEQLKEHDITLDLQPVFVQGDFPWVVERIGEERLAASYAWKTLIEAGIPCAGGSDAPIEPLSPLLGIYSAITRNHHPNSNHDYHESQKLTARQALDLFTLGSAFVAGEEHERGSITVGKYADFTVLDRDLFQSTPEEIRDARILATVVNGKMAYMDPIDFSL